MQVYDTMSDGIIGRETMFQLLRTSLISQGGEEDAEESVKVKMFTTEILFVSASTLFFLQDMLEVITKKMDLDRDGKISFKDYKQTVLNQPMMLEALGTCLPSRYAAHAFITSFTPKTGKM